MGDDARDREPDEPTREQPAVPPGRDETQDFDPTTMPPSDPYLDDTDVTMAADDHTYDPTAQYEPPEVWSGRAGVPPPGTRPAVPGETEWPSPQPPRRVLPVIFGVVLALLVGLLALGLWLALRDKGQPNPPASPTPPATTAGTPSAPPTTTSPSPTASASPSVATVLLPDLSGVSYATAADLLSGKGLVPNRVDRVSTTVPPGVVIGTDPQGPANVPAGSTVTVFVAVAPPTTAPASPSPSAS